MLTSIPSNIFPILSHPYSYYAAPHDGFKTYLRQGLSYYRHHWYTDDQRFHSQILSTTLGCNTDIWFLLRTDMPMPQKHREG